MVEQLAQANAANFTIRLMNPASRFKTMPIKIYGSQTPDATLGTSDSARAIDDGAAGWSNVGSNLRMSRVGSHVITRWQPGNGTIEIGFNDPAHEIANPSGCSGVLAIGGFASDYQSDSQGYYGISGGAVMVNDGWGGCGFWTEKNLSEVLAHEVGHAIGFDHSNNSGCGGTGALSNATMAPCAHFDGRGATLKEYDIAAAKFLYGEGSGPGPSPSPSPTATPQCQLAKSDLTLSPSYQSGTSGSQFAVVVSVRNNHSAACDTAMPESKTFALTFSSNSLAGPGSVNLLVPAGQTHSVTAQLGTPPSLGNGIYSYTFETNNLSQASLKATAQGQIELTSSNPGTPTYSIQLSTEPSAQCVTSGGKIQLIGSPRITGQSQSGLAVRFFITKPDGTTIERLARTTRNHPDTAVLLYKPTQKGSFNVKAELRASGDRLSDVLAESNQRTFCAQ